MNIYLTHKNEQQSAENLDDFRLEEKIQFEKEGPNGTGQFLGRITLLG